MLEDVIFAVFLLLFFILVDFVVCQVGRRRR